MNTMFLFADGRWIGAETKAEGSGMGTRKSTIGRISIDFDQVDAVLLVVFESRRPAVTPGPRRSDRARSSL